MGEEGVRSGGSEGGGDCGGSGEAGFGGGGVEGGRIIGANLNERRKWNAKIWVAGRAQGDGGREVVREGGSQRGRKLVDGWKKEAMDEGRDNGRDGGREEMIYGKGGV